MALKPAPFMLPRLSEQELLEMDRRAWELHKTIETLERDVRKCKEGFELSISAQIYMAEVLRGLRADMQRCLDIVMPYRTTVVQEYIGDITHHLACKLVNGESKETIRDLAANLDILLFWHEWYGLKVADKTMLVLYYGLTYEPNSTIDQNPSPETISKAIVEHRGI
jgi:hypothetical protein